MVSVLSFPCQSPSQLLPATLPEQQTSNSAGRCLGIRANRGRNTRLNRSTNLSSASCKARSTDVLNQLPSSEPLAHQKIQMPKSKDSQPSKRRRYASNFELTEAQKECGQRIASSSEQQQQQQFMSSLVNNAHQMQQSHAAQMQNAAPRVQQHTSQLQAQGQPRQINVSKSTLNPEAQEFVPSMLKWNSTPSLLYRQENPPIMPQYAANPMQHHHLPMPVGFGPNIIPMMHQHGPEVVYHMQLAAATGQPIFAPMHPMDPRAAVFQMPYGYNHMVPGPPPYMPANFYHHQHEMQAAPQSHTQQHVEPEQQHQLSSHREGLPAAQTLPAMHADPGQQQPEQFVPGQHRPSLKNSSEPDNPQALGVVHSQKLSKIAAAAHQQLPDQPQQIPQHLSTANQSHPQDAEKAPSHSPSLRSPNLCEIRSV